MSDNNMVWDPQYESFICKTIHNPKELLQKLITHLEDGGTPNPRVVAGALKVSLATIYRWLDPKSPHYQPEFRQLFDQYKMQAAYRTDSDHLKMARGEIKGDSTAMNKRYQRICFGASERLRVKMSHEKKVDAVYKDYQDGNISAEEAQAWIKSVDNAELQKALERAEFISEMWEGQKKKDG